MTDLITLTGPLVDHQGAAPLAGVTVTATPSRDITRTSDGEDALTGATATTDETGTFELELVHAAGLRYLIQYRVQGKVLRPYTLDCDSWPAGSTVSITDLPPIAGVPPSAVEDLQAWLLARLAEGMSPETIEAAVIAYLDENPVGIPAHNDTTGRDAADAHPMATISGLVSALAGKQAAGSYATAAQGAKADTAVQPADLGPYATDADLSGHASDTTAVHGIADTSALVLTTDPRLADARTPTAHKSTHASGGTDALTPADIGAATSGHTHAAPDLSGYVPTSRTVNGKALSSNVTLNAADVGASTFSGDYDDLTGKPTLGTAAATAATDYATAAQGAKADAAIPSGLVDAKGDLIVATADNTVTRLPAGTDGHVLTLDSAEAAGVKWAASGGGGGGTMPPSPTGIYTLPIGTGKTLAEQALGLDGSSATPRTYFYGPTWQAPATYQITAVRITQTGTPPTLSGQTCRVGVVEIGPDDQPIALVSDLGTFDATVIGEKDFTDLSIPIQAGKNYAGVIVQYGGNGSVQVRAWTVPYGDMGQNASVPNRANQTRRAGTGNSDPGVGFETAMPAWTVLTAGANSTPGSLEFLQVQRSLA